MLAVFGFVVIEDERSLSLKSPRRGARYLMFGPGRLMVETTQIPLSFAGR